MQHDHSTDQCPECDTRLEADPKHGELACPDCGLVVSEDALDRGAEWRAFDAREKGEKARVGAPRTETLHDRGLSTTISWRDTDARGNPLSPRQRQKMQRLRLWNKRCQTGSTVERNLRKAFGEVNRMASALGLSLSVRETACVIYRRASEEDLLPGRSIEAVATAALYGAARQAGVPRSLDECTTVSRVERIEIMRAYRFITRELGLAIEPADPAQYVPRIVSELELPEQAQRQACNLLDIAAATGYTSGKHPVGLAAAAVYAASCRNDWVVTQAALSEVADISAVTIRNRYQELLETASDRSISC